MTLENRPLLRSSTEMLHSPRRRHLNRTMSLRAALLAFPLPRDTGLVRRHTTATHRPSPLSSYNSNYTRLATERRSRLQQRKLDGPKGPEYALPESYAEIQRIFPPAQESDSSSIVVEIDSPKNTSDFTLFEDPPSHSVGHRIHRTRERVMFEGGIAARQKLRKKNRQKAPREVSANIIRGTGHVLGKTVTGTLEGVRDAFEVVRESTGQLSKLAKIVRKWKLKKENSENIPLEDAPGQRYRRARAGDGLREYEASRDVLQEYSRGDELHKYLYDLHGAGLETQSSTDRLSSSGYVVPIDNQWGRRRQTWTNLDSVLMDKEDSVEGQGGTAEETQEGLPVIEEVLEISQCGISPRTPGRRVSVRDILWEEGSVKGYDGGKRIAKSGNVALKKVEEYLHGLEISPPSDTPIDPNITNQHPKPNTTPIQNTLSHPQHSPSKPSQSSNTFKPTDPLPSDHWETFSTTSAPMPDTATRLPLSQPTQDLFNPNSTTYYTSNNDEEPVKSEAPPAMMEAEITRSSDILEHYLHPDTGTITFPDHPVPRKQSGGDEDLKGRGVDRVVEGGHIVSGDSVRIVSGHVASSSYSDILGGQEIHYKRQLSASSSSVGAIGDTTFQRQVSSIYSRPQNSRQISTSNPFGGVRSTSDSTQGLSVSEDADGCILIPPTPTKQADKSIPAIDAFKWVPPLSPLKPSKGSPATIPTAVLQNTLGDGREGIKSVRDRVRELDLAIDSADNFGSGAALKRKRSLFGIGRWRERF